MKSVIFYIGNFDRPELNAAGKRVYGNALILEKLGYRVVLIGKHKEGTSMTPVRYTADIVFYSFPNESLVKTDVYITYLEKVISSEGKPSIIIRYGSPGLAIFDNRLNSYCKKEKIKMVADVVDWLPSGGNSPIFNIVKGIDTFLEKGIFNKRSDGVIAISSYLEKYYQKSHCKTVVIPPVVRQYIENKTYNNSIRLVYAGVPFRLGRIVKKSSEVKDRLDLAVEAVVETAGRGANVVLEIYGITEEQYLTAYPAHRSLLKSGAVIFFGRKDMKKVQEIVNQADFTILLRDQNRATMAGFPTKVVESLSCGTPVITTKTSDLENYITNGVNGYFVSTNNKIELVDEMQKILSIDRESIDRMKKECFESRQFLLDNFEESLSGFLKKL